jgi:hypothetical protein
MLLGLAYLVLTVAGNALERRRPEVGSNLKTLGFGALLLAAAWTVVLLVMSLVDYPVRMSDLATIFLTTFIFFGLLLAVLFLLSEVRVGGRPVGTYVGVLLAVVMVVFIVLAVV